mgnify:FL=1
MTRTIEKIILGVLVIAIISVSSLFIAGLDTNKSPETQESQKSSNFISLDQAKTIALEVTDGTITEAVLGKENGISVYEIEVTNGNLETGVKIDPSNGNIIDVETEKEEEITTEDLKRIEEKITEAKAKEIALNEVNGRVIKVDIEKEGGRVLYDVEVKEGNNIAEVEIDAETGEVIEVEWEDDESDD